MIITTNIHLDRVRPRISPTSNPTQPFWTWNFEQLEYYLECSAIVKSARLNGHYHQYQYDQQELYEMQFKKVRSAVQCNLPRVSQYKKTTAAESKIIVSISNNIAKSMSVSPTYFYSNIIY